MQLIDPQFIHIGSVSIKDTLDVPNTKSLLKKIAQVSSIPRGVKAVNFTYEGENTILDLEEAYQNIEMNPSQMERFFLTDIMAYVMTTAYGQEDGKLYTTLFATDGDNLIKWLKKLAACEPFDPTEMLCIYTLPELDQEQLNDARLVQQMLTGFDEIYTAVKLTH